MRVLLSSITDPVDVASTCETCGHFYRQAVQPRWQTYEKRVEETRAAAGGGEKGSGAVAVVAEAFPFASFFSRAKQPLFKGESFAEDWEMALGCMRHLNHVFEMLREYRPFEQVHRGRDRSKYLLTKEAKIVAMTCTHAALTRHDLVSLLHHLSLSLFVSLSLSLSLSLSCHTALGCSCSCLCLVPDRWMHLGCVLVTGKAWVQVRQRDYGGGGADP